MAEPRLASGLWVQAHLRRLDGLAIPAFVRARGDETAGAILVKLATLDGSARLFARRFDMMADRLIWEETAAGPEWDVDEAWRRARSTDPDLWVIEIEDRAGRHLLEPAPQ